MLKKILTFIIIALIAIQIPIIISLSNAKGIAKKLESYQAKMEKTSVPMKAAKGILAFPQEVTKGIFSIFKKVPLVKEVPFVSQIGDVTSMISGGEESLKGAIAVTKQMTMAMYLNMFLIFILMILLLFISKKSFIQNLGFSVLFNGILCLVALALVYYFFVTNFEKTFEYFYGQAGLPGKKQLMPFVPNIVKSFSRDFVVSIVKSVLFRNMIGALIGIPLGAALIFLNKFISKKFNFNLTK